MRLVAKIAIGLFLASGLFPVREEPTRPTDRPSLLAVAPAAIRDLREKQAAAHAKFARAEAERQAAVMHGLEREATERQANLLLRLERDARIRQAAMLRAARQAASERNAPRRSAAAESGIGCASPLRCRTARLRFVGTAFLPG